MSVDESTLENLPAGQASQTVLLVGVPKEQSGDTPQVTGLNTSLSLCLINPAFGVALPPLAPTFLRNTCGMYRGPIQKQDIVLR